jgi:hypothetical protein
MTDAERAEAREAGWMEGIRDALAACEAQIETWDEKTPEDALRIAGGLRCVLAIANAAKAKTKDW